MNMLFEKGAIVNTQDIVSIRINCESQMNEWMDEIGTCRLELYVTSYHIIIFVYYHIWFDANNMIYDISQSVWNGTTMMVSVLSGLWYVY